MSLFLNSLKGNQEMSQEKVDVAGVQFDAMCSTFNNILRTCLEKCIPHEGYSESELTKGEMCCIDPVCGENALQQPPHRRVCTDTRVRAGEPATTLLPVPAKTNGRRLQELAANTRDSVYIVVTSMYSK